MGFRSGTWPSMGEGGCHWRQPFGNRARTRADSAPP